MKQLMLAVRYFMLMIIVFGFMSALAMCVWFVTSSPRYVSILGGIVGAAWWVFRIVHYQIHKNEIRKR